MVSRKEQKKKVAQLSYPKRDRKAKREDGLRTRMQLSRLHPQ